MGTGALDVGTPVALPGLRICVAVRKRSADAVTVAGHVSLAIP